MSAPAKFDEKAVKKAARELCRLRGEDPDEEIGRVVSEARFDVMRYEPRWKNYAPAVRERMQMDAAINGYGFKEMYP